MDDDIPYLLLTPGPLTTSTAVRAAMQRDYSTWDVDYNEIVQSIRDQLAGMAVASGEATSVLMQGSGTFSVEATIASVLGADDELLVVNNGAYGARMVTICERLGVTHRQLDCGERRPPSPSEVTELLVENPGITHVAMVHCETTTGMLNPVAEIGEVVKDHGRYFLVDAMSSFGGVPLTLESIHADYLISSANKCIQGVPGFGFVISRPEQMREIAGRSRSLSLDIHDQWREMEEKNGKWRFTSPTHTVCAFAVALQELQAEGGVEARYQRYQKNQQLLVDGMRQLGFHPLLPEEWHSAVITAFYDPCPDFDFQEFYDQLKAHRFVIYPGKVTDAPTFRIGTIGHVFPADIELLLRAIREVIETMKVHPTTWWETGCTA